MEVLDKIKAPVAAELEQFREAFRQTLYSENPLLEQVVEHLLKAPGKQLPQMEFGRDYRSSVSDLAVFAHGSLVFRPSVCESGFFTHQTHRLAPVYSWWLPGIISIQFW